MLFQFTHPGGVRRSAPYQTLLSVRFQFTHPGGVRLARKFDATFRCSFNSRTREGCDRSSIGYVVAVDGFQFTHPGGVRLAKRSNTPVTRSFNSRTREGCDVVPGRPQLLIRFQFTHPGGVRRESIATTSAETTVSIHAPGRGATKFNPFRLLAYQFQFTHPGGVRPKREAPALTPASSFNSRTREGCD